MMTVKNAPAAGLAAMLGWIVAGGAALGGGAAAAADLAAAAAKYAEVCATCHGRKARGMASFPSIAGKTEDYLAGRLAQYRAGEKVGPNSALMIPVAGELSDADAANLAAYIAATFK